MPLLRLPQVARSLVATVALVTLAACASPRPPASPPAAVELSALAAREPATAAIAAPEADTGDLGPIPVTRDDPTWGDREALVTVVEFGDYQCPFCVRAEATLDQLKHDYGAHQIRIVWKNHPLPFHDRARPAAEAGVALFERGGNAWFWSYHDALFAREPQRVDYEGASRFAGLDARDLRALMGRDSVRQKVDADIALAGAVGATGTPAFFINGVSLSGAQPVDKFREVIDAELVAAKALVASGTPAARVYAVAVAKNFEAPAVEPVHAQAAVDDTTPWRVPVGGAPVRGRANALVTLVMFAEMQCPFCIRVEPTIAQLTREYGDKLRVVWKHAPLPFHARAEPAAELMVEARAERGDAGFWAVHDLLVAENGHLEDANLESVARAAGLQVKAALDAVHARKHAAIIVADQEDADDVQASGTPHFFINGRRFIGAQPIEAFREAIDAELAVAAALVKSGTPPAKVYETLQATAKGPPPPEHKKVAPPTSQNPSRGPAGAKLVVQLFSDFQCPYCARLMPTIAELEAAFPGKVRVVWRNLPLSFHANAEPAAEAAMEAFRQKGDAGFWRMAALLFQDQQNLDRAGLEHAAQQAGLDLAELRRALDTNAHKPRIDADAKVAFDASISGTPGIVINGYFISGAQPLAKFKKVAARALAEAK